MEQIQSVKDILCKAIEDRRLVRFYYESKTSKRKAWRTVEPYILAIKDKGKGNTFLAALPIRELSKNIHERETGHYLLEQIDVEKLEVLDTSYDEPHVARTRITDTPTIQVICRFMYPDETRQ